MSDVYVTDHYRGLRRDQFTIDAERFARMKSEMVYFETIAQERRNYFDALIKTLPYGDGLDAHVMYDFVELFADAVERIGNGPVYIPRPGDSTKQSHSSGP